jgi:hypothetical protein
MSSPEEAMALSSSENDDFYVDAYYIQAWLAESVARTQAEYVEKRKSGQRVLQMGQAQSSFLRTFGPVGHSDFHRLQHNLYRFAEHDHPHANILFRAMIPLSLEHELAGDFVGNRAANPAARPHEAVALMRSSFDRWCDWVDAVIHMECHARWHLSPHNFGMDPSEGRSIQSIGYRRLWAFQEVDEAAICLWPLIKRHNWTYGDLLNVLRDVLRRPEVHPCRSEQALTNYCTQTLGLHRPGRGKTTVNTRPPGYELALRLCPPLRRPSELGLPPWCWDSAETTLPPVNTAQPSFQEEQVSEQEVFGFEQGDLFIPNLIFRKPEIQ